MISRTIGFNEVSGLLDHNPQTLVRVGHDIGRGIVDKESSISTLSQVPKTLRNLSYDKATGLLHKTNHSWVDTSYVGEVEGLLSTSRIAEKARKIEPISQFLVEGLSQMNTYCIAMTSAGIGSGKYRVRTVLRQLKKLERQMEKRGFAPRKDLQEVKKTFKQLPQPLWVTDLASAAKDGLKALLKRV